MLGSWIWEDFLVEMEIWVFEIGVYIEGLGSFNLLW